jgi:hypothetical protein
MKQFRVEYVYEAVLGILLALACAQPLSGQAPVSRPVTRQYVGQIGAHNTVEMTLSFARESVSGLYRQADGGPEWRLEGRTDAGKLALRALNPAGRETAQLALEASEHGLLQGTWRSTGGQQLGITVEEVGNDLPGADSLNGHYVRQGQSSGGALDLLLLDASRVKVQGYASWAGAGGAAAGEVVGYGVLADGIVRIEARGGCELTIEPVEGGLEVKSKGRCAGDFAGRYVRRSATVPDWETFNWSW